MGLLRLGGSILSGAIKRPGASLGTLDNVLTIGGLGLAGAQLPGMSGRTNKELARDFDIKDIDGAYDNLEWHQKLPFIGATKEGLEKQIRNQEAKEIEASTAYQTAAGYLDADQLPDVTGMSKTQATTALGTAVRNTRQQRATEAGEREFLSLGNRYIMEMAERSRRDSINERADNRIQQMEMYKMGIEREDRRDRRDARMQLVAALTGSLGNLGNAFASI